MSIVSSNGFVTTLSSGIVGASLLSVSTSSPMGSVLNEAQTPHKDIAFMSMNDLERHERLPDKASRRETAFTADQIACAERLGVANSECNAQGVYTNRSSQITRKIFAALNVNSWDDVTPEDLASITRLNLMNQSLWSVSAEDLDGLTGLHKLKLSFNNLAEVTIPSHLSSLTELWVQNNILTSISGLEHLTNLKYLYLSNNRFKTITVPNTLTSLRYITVSGNYLTTLEIPETLSELVYIYATNNQLTSVSLPSTLRNLDSLSLFGNRLRSIVLDDQWVNLKDLSLNKNQLSDLSVPDSYAYLKFLNLSNNQLTSIDLPQVLADLKRLDLANNRLSTSQFSTDLSYMLNGGVPSLTKLNISGTQNQVTLSGEVLNYPFLNQDAQLIMNRDSLVVINGVEYRWLDVRGVFGLTDMEGSVDILHPESDFQFSETTTSVQRSFLSDLLSLPSHSFPDPNN